MITRDELALIGVECDYCNVDDRVLYAWHGDIWCAQCMFESISDQLPLLTFSIPVTDDPDIMDYADIRDYAVPMLWQTPDGRIRAGKVFHGVYPQTMLDESVYHQTPAHYARSLTNIF